jgi:fucose permease
MRGTAVAVLLAALGGAALSTGSTVLMPQAFFGPLEATASVNLGNVFFALGALLTPPLVDVLSRSLGLKRTLALLAFVCMLPAFPAALASGESLELPGRAGQAAFLPGQEYVWLAGLVFFFYAPLEAAVAIWTTTYLTELGHPERRAAWLLSGFWTAFLVSRLLTAAAQHADILPARFDTWLLVLPPLAAAVVLGNLAGTAHRRTPGAGLLLLGFLLGPIFPTLVGILLRRYPEEPGMAYGLVFALGSAGSLTLGPLFNRRAARGTVQGALRIPMILALVLTGAALVFSLAAP